RRTRPFTATSITDSPTPWQADVNSRDHPACSPDLAPTDAVCGKVPEFCSATEFGCAKSHMSGSTNAKESDMLTRREALWGTVAGAASAAILRGTPAIAARPVALDVATLPRER